MPGSFDPYHKWLAIPPEDQPPDHYRLLAVPRFEEDPDVIAAAADRQMAHLRTYQSGPHAPLPSGFSTRWPPPPAKRRRLRRAP